MNYKRKLIIITMLLIWAGGIGSADPKSPTISESTNNAWTYPEDVLCELKWGDFFEFMADQFAEVSQRKTPEDLQQIEQTVSNLPIIQTSKSFKDLYKQLNTKFLYWRVTGESYGSRALVELFNAKKEGDSPSASLRGIAEGKRPIPFRYGRLKAIGLVLRGEILSHNPCETKDLISLNDKDLPQISMNKFRQLYHDNWIGEAYRWFIENYPEKDQRLKATTDLWEPWMPVLVEGAEGDRREEDIEISKDGKELSRIDRLDQYATRTAGFPVNWYMVNWSRSFTDEKGNIQHPSIVTEHLNFDSQFLGAIELFHIMRRAISKGTSIQLIAFSAGSNVLFMATKMYRAQFKQGKPFNRVLIVQGSIYQGLSLNDLLSLMGPGGKVIVTRNNNDSFLLQVGTQSPIGLAGGNKLFGRGEGIGFNGPTDQGTREMVDVLDIREVRAIDVGRTPSSGQGFGNRLFKESSKSQHWLWFTPENLRRLMGQLKFSPGPKIEQ